MIKTLKKGFMNKKYLSIILLSFSLLLCLHSNAQNTEATGTTQTIVYEDVPFVPEIDSIMKWIMVRVKSDKMPYCYKNNGYNRGVGVPATNTCPDGKVDRSGFCYTPCLPGYYENALTCAEPCPPGYTDAGACIMNNASYAAPSRLGDCPPNYDNTLFECYRFADTYYAPSVLADCPSGFTNMGTYCYKWVPAESRPLSDATCPNGYFKGFLGRCYVNCRAGYTNNGDFCGRGDDHLGLGAVVCPAGYFKSVVPVASCFMNCKNQYHNTGETCLSENTFYNRNFYSMAPGVGKLCPAGTERDPSDVLNIGLCYTKCRDGYEGAVTTCFQKCPIGWVNCGLACAINSETCAEVTINQIFSVVTLAANIASLGLTSTGTAGAGQAIKFGYKTLVSSGSTLGEYTIKLVKGLQSWQVLDDAGQLVKNVTIYQRVKNTFIGGTDFKFDVNILQTTNQMYTDVANYVGAIETDFPTSTSQEINDLINSKYSPEAAKFIKQQWAKFKIKELSSPDGFQIASDVLSTLSLGDPTGVLSVVEAFTKPICKDLFLYPLPLPSVLLNGSNPPSSTTGAVGNYYLKTTTPVQYYGPKKADGTWPLFNYKF